MLSPDFLLTSLVVVLIPGTGVIYTVTNGLFNGWRASIAAALGCTAGIIPHLLASILGLATILHMSALAFQLVKFAGAGYLIYLAWLMWRETGALSFDKPQERSGWVRIAVRGLLINILNPKLSIFFLAFLPQFIPATSSAPLTHMFLLSAIFMAMTFVVFVAYGVSAHGVRSYVANSPRLILRMQRMFALIFAGLGAKLALAEQ